MVFEAFWCYPILACDSRSASALFSAYEEQAFEII